MKIPAPLKTISVIPYGWRLLLFDDREIFNQYIRATHPADMHAQHCVSKAESGGPSGRTLINAPARLAVVGLFGNDAGECASLGTVAHELLHVVLAVFDYIEMPVTEENSEASCYLLQYLINEAWPVIVRNYSITLNKPRKRK